ncbi:MAG: baseplate J/gp47 family protein [Microgenomates group bacterium]
MLDFLQKPKNEIKENFWSILIEPEWISSSVWQIEEEKVKIISKSPSTRWEGNLLEAVDISLSASMQNLPEDTPDPSKTVFGVPSSWIDGGNIKSEYLEDLKKLCDKLSLVPSGFVVLSEAISNLIKNEEESQLTGVVVGVSDQNLEISVFNLGVLAGVTNVSRSISVEDDLTEGLTRLASKVDNFPARIILFNQKEQELEEILETLNNSDWDKVANSKFMHTPRIEIFDPAKKIVAVSLAGGSELGVVTGISTNLDNQVLADNDETLVNNLPIEELDNIEEPEGVTAEDLGFVQEGAVQNSIPLQEVEHVSSVPHLNIPKMPEFKFKKPEIHLPKLNSIFAKFSGFTLGSKPLVIGGVGLLTFMVAGFVMWWFLPKADVTIYVSPKKLEENISVSLDSGVENKTVEVKVDGEKTKSTSGTKTVGDKAKGSVKLQNGTAFPINLPSGSVLVSSTDLKFVTTESASISGALSPANPGTSTVKVEANSIGSEFNLGKDEVFKVANYPKAEVDGTSVEPFTGGSSRQISAVSADDRESLLESLTEELMEEAKTKLSAEISDGDYLIETSLESEVDEETYSNKVGDEATTIKLSLSLVVKAVSVSKSDLSNLAKETLKDKVPTGFVLKDSQLSYEFVSNDEGFDVKVIANLLPSIDPTEIAKKIAGRYPELAESYLSSVPGFVKAEFKFRPLLPGKLGTLPHVPKNMSVEFSADK